MEFVIMLYPSFPIEFISLDIHKFSVTMNIAVYCDVAPCNYSIW